MDEDDLYDEFGNYIGPELGSDEDEDLEEKRFEEVSDDDDDDLFGFDEEAALVVRGDGPPGTVLEDNSNAIVLHEDKQYYPDAEDVYPGVETVVMDEDAMLIQEPICKPIKVKNLSVLERNVPNSSAPRYTVLTEEPDLIRHLRAGHCSGRRRLDILVESTHVNMAFGCEHEICRHKKGRTGERTEYQVCSFEFGSSRSQREELHDQFDRHPGSRGLCGRNLCGNAYLRRCGRCCGCH